MEPTKIVVGLPVKEFNEAGLKTPRQVWPNVGKIAHHTAGYETQQFGPDGVVGICVKEFMNKALDLDEKFLVDAIKWAKVQFMNHFGLSDEDEIVPRLFVIGWQV